MTTDRDFDRIANAWLADGPDELSDRVLDAVVDQIHLTRQRRAMRVPWRLPTMTTPARVAAAAAIGVLAVGAIFVLRPGQPAVGGPTPSPSAVPSASPAPSSSTGALVLPALTQTFTSIRHGYSVSYPAGWTTTAATAGWSAGTTANWGSPALDAIQTDTVRFVGASQRVGAGQSTEAYLAALCLLGNGSTSECAAATTTWPQIQIGGRPGYLTTDGVNALGGTIAPLGDSKLYDAAAVVNGRGYDFSMDGLVDRAMFQAFLDAVVFAPASASDLPLTPRTFASPWYGYAMHTANAWTSTPATKHFLGTDGSGPASDAIEIAGTDSTIRGASQPLAKGQTYDQWVATYTASVAPGPPGCKRGPIGGAPTSIGADTGHHYELCSVDAAIVEKGGRIYLFTLSSASLDGTQHLTPADFLTLLTTVTLDPANARD